MTKTNDIIDELVEDNKEVKPVCYTKRSVLWLVFALVTVTLISASIGIRNDLADKLDSPVFLIELLLAMATGLLAALAANWLSIPDIKQQKWVIWLPFIPLTILCFLVGYEIFQTPIDLINEPESMHCAQSILMIIAIPTIVLFFLIKFAATTHSTLASIMAVISVSGFGYLCSRLICPNDTLEHILLWHYSPIVVIASIAAFIGSKVLKW